MKPFPSERDHELDLVAHMRQNARDYRTGFTECATLDGFVAAEWLAMHRPHTRRDRDENIWN